MFKTLLALSLLFVVSCSTAQHSSGVNSNVGSQGSGSNPGKGNTGTTTPNPFFSGGSGQSALLPNTTTKAAGTNNSANPNTANTGATGQPKLGVVLGPGGTKAITEIGVLRELELAHVPVEAIVGLEWGALIGALYSVNGRANDVEWKIGKLKQDLFPKEKLFGSGIEPVSISNFSNYFATVFENKQVQNLKVPFSCPTFNVTQKKVVWLQTGSITSAMNFCVPYPPVFNMPTQAFARPREILGAIEWLKQHGATHILMVNVLGGNQQILKRNLANRETTENLWQEVRSEIFSAKDSFSWIAEINTDANDLMTVTNFRNLIEVGRQGSQSVISTLARQLGY